MINNILFKIIFFEKLFFSFYRRAVRLLSRWTGTPVWGCLFLLFFTSIRSSHGLLNKTPQPTHWAGTYDVHIDIEWSCSPYLLPMWDYWNFNYVRLLLHIFPDKTKHDKTIFLNIFFLFRVLSRTKLWVPSKSWHLQSILHQVPVELMETTLPVRYTRAWKGEDQNWIHHIPIIIITKGKQQPGPPRQSTRNHLLVTKTLLTAKNQVP